MKCEDYQERISLYVDDVLTLDEKKQLEKHLEHCLSCRETLETLLMMKSVMHEIKEVEVPKTFHDDLHKRLCQEVKPKKKVYKWMPYASGLVAALLIGFVLVDGGVSQEQPIQDAPIPMAASLDNTGVAPIAMENESEVADVGRQSRGAMPSEEVWQINCTDLKAAKAFLEDYTTQHEVSMVEWQIDSEYHLLLEPIEDKEVLKSILEDEMWVDGAIQITVMDTSKVHLILNVQE